MKADRHEKVRADWLLAHEAGWHMSDRRMATRLSRKAAQKDRSAAGASESSHHEGHIKPLAMRFLARGEDSKDTMFRHVFLVVVVAPLVVIGFGPALLGSLALYGLASTGLLGLKRVPRSWPWLIAAVFVGVGGWLLVQPSGFLHITPWPLSVDLDGAQFLASYGWLQLTLGLLFTAWQIRRHGWPGVTIKSKPKTPKVPSLNVPAPASTPKVATTEQSAAPVAPKLPVAPSLPVAFEVFEDDAEAKELAGWMVDEPDEIEGEHSNV